MTWLDILLRKWKPMDEIVPVHNQTYQVTSAFWKCPFCCLPSFLLQWRVFIAINPHPHHVCTGFHPLLISQRSYFSCHSFIFIHFYYLSLNSEMNPMSVLIHLALNLAHHSIGENKKWEVSAFSALASCLYYHIKWLKIGLIF